LKSGKSIIWQSAGPAFRIGADEWSFLEVTPLRRVIPGGGRTTFTVSVTGIGNEEFDILLTR